MNYPFTGLGQNDFRVTNREDLLINLSIYDDDLGQAINVSGTTLAGSTPFTGSNWTITGVIIPSAFSPGFSGGFGSTATSTTQLTIPVYPIGSQLTQVTLTTGLNLGITPGTLVTIADPTGLNTMTGVVISYASATGVLVVQVGWTFEFEIRSGGPHGWWDNGFVPWFDVGTVSNDQPIISAQLGNGIMMLDLGIIQVRIPASLMQQLRGATYRMAMNATDGYDTRQLMLDPLHVLSGGLQTAPISNTTQSAWEAIF